MDRKQYLLRHILDPVWRPVLPPSEGMDEGQNFGQQPLIGRAVAVLRRRHEPRPVLVPREFVIRSSRRHFGCGKPTCNRQLRGREYWDEQKFGEKDRYGVKLRPTARVLLSRSRQSVAIGRGAPGEAVKQVEHAPAPSTDRIAGRQHLQIADRACPLEGAEDEVIGIARAASQTGNPAVRRCGAAGRGWCGGLAAVLAGRARHSRGWR